MIAHLVHVEVALENALLEGVRSLAGFGHLLRWLHDRNALRAVVRAERGRVGLCGRDGAPLGSGAHALLEAEAIT